MPVGVLWRRVYEVSGGDWTKVETALQSPGVWKNTIFAYNLSIACNHCIHPKCAGVCSTNAYNVRDDGIVYIDESKCMGCGYCSWACPYSAPQYNPISGHMTKCDFCFDNLDLGLPPTCVSACPMRVLDIVTADDRPRTADGTQPLWSITAEKHPYPLPAYSHTEPHLAIRSHVGMLNDLDKAVSNQEEIKPRKVKSELSLVAFTLMTQMAAGMAVFSLFSGPLKAPILITIGLLLGNGGIISFLHLGKPLNAWQALNHLKKSWLSREILMFGLFGFSWLLCWIVPGIGKLPLAIFGIGLIYSMAQVYRLRSVPAWDSNRTLLAFSVSAVVLGGFVLEIFAPSTIRLLFVEIGLGAAFWQLLSEQTKTHETRGKLRLSLIVLAMIGVVTMALSPNTIRAWLAVPIFLMVLVEEIIGRWLFYEHFQNRPL